MNHIVLRVVGILLMIAGFAILIKEKIDHPRKFSSSGCLMPSLGFGLLLLGAGIAASTT